MPLYHKMTCHLLITRKTGSLLTACCHLFVAIAVVGALAVFCSMKALPLPIAAALSLAITVSSALSITLALTAAITAGCG